MSTQLKVFIAFWISSLAAPASSQSVLIESDAFLDKNMVILCPFAFGSFFRGAGKNFIALVHHELFQRLLSLSNIQELNN
jgi:hypothetical protein